MYAFPQTEMSKENFLHMLLCSYCGVEIGGINLSLSFLVRVRSAQLVTTDLKMNKYEYCSVSCFRVLRRKNLLGSNF